MTQLDLSPLGHRRNLPSRLRAIGASPRLVIGAALGGLILLGPLIGILVALLGAETDWGFVGTMALFSACGAWVLIEVLRKAGTGADLAGLARVNDLDLTRSAAARHYAGSRFRSGERIVLNSLRTRTVPALEVGDTWSTQPVQFRVRSSVTVSAENPPQAEGFLRVVLPGADHPPLEALSLPPQLDEALFWLLGHYRLEQHGGELTVMGSKPLEPGRPEQVTTAFDLAAELARVAGAPSTDPRQAPAPAQPDGARRTRHPLAIVGAVLALLIVLPVGLAIIMSALEGLDLSEGAVRAVLTVFIGVCSLVVALLLRWATAGRRRSRDRETGDDLRRDRRTPHDERAH